MENPLHYTYITCCFSQQYQLIVLLRENSVEFRIFKLTWTIVTPDVINVFELE